MKKPKFPKLKNRPKQPKKSASASVWENYREKYDRIEKENDEKVKEYNKKMKEYRKEQAKKSPGKRTQTKPFKVKPVR